MLSFMVPLEFIWTRSTPTWREVGTAIENGWLRPKDAIDIANRRLEASGPVDRLEYDLAGRQSDDPVLETVWRLASREAPQDERQIKRKWLRLVLLWAYHHRQQFKDPLEVVEDIWCEFDHPAELNRFIRYMPAENAIRVEQRTLEENLAALRQGWEEYMNVLDREFTAERWGPEV